MALTTEEILIKIKTEEKGFDKINQEVRELENRLNRLSSGKGRVSNFSWFKDQQTTLNNAKIAVQQYNTELASNKGASGFAGNSAMIGGAISGLVSGFASLYAAQKLWELSLDSKKFEVLKANFQGSEEDLNNFKIATARTVSEANLIKLSNQATDLGVSLHDQTILFSLAEDAADKYGTSVEDGFNKVIMATEGNVRGLKALGIQKEVYEKIVKDLAAAHGKEIDQLDPEIQKEIRLQAIIKASGTTFEDATNKIQDSADQQESIWVFLGDIVTEYGWSAVKAIVAPINALEEAGNAILNFKQRWDEFLIKGSDYLDMLYNLTNGVAGIRKEAQQPIKVTIEIGATVSDLANSYWSILYGQDLRKWSTAKDIQAKSPTRSKTETGKGPTKTAKQEDLTLEQQLNKQYKENLENLILYTAVYNNANNPLWVRIEALKQILDLEQRLGIRIKTGKPITTIPEDQQGLFGTPFQGSGKGKFGKAKSSEQIDNQEEVNKLMLEGWNDVMNIAQQIDTIFGQAGAEIIQAFQTAFSLANSISSLILAIIKIASMFGGGIPLPGLSGGGRAGGGSVNAGTLYRVNENNTEWFRPNVSGTVIPLMNGNQGNNFDIGVKDIKIKGKDMIILLEKVLPTANANIERVTG